MTKVYKILLLYKWDITEPVHHRLNSELKRSHKYFPTMLELVD